jgi:hypothetical protein
MKIGHEDDCEDVVVALDAWFGCCASDEDDEGDDDDSC